MDIDLDLLPLELKEMVTDVIEGRGDLFIELPVAGQADYTVEDLAAAVARTSNLYGRASRLMGIASAEEKRAIGAYKHVFRANKVGGTNADEREAAAAAAAEEWTQRMITIEYASAIIGGVERAARVASESARKMYDKVQAQSTAYNRGAAVEHRYLDY